MRLSDKFFSEENFVSPVLDESLLIVHSVLMFPNTVQRVVREEIRSDLADGHVLVKIIFISLDPAMRGVL